MDIAVLGDRETWPDSNRVEREAAVKVPELLRHVKGDGFGESRGDKGDENQSSPGEIISYFSPSS
jgi:hypothetical protein